MNDKNLFGGANPNALYTPLSEDEQEVLARLAETNAFKVVVKEWGYVDKPQVRYGDARLQVRFQLNFAKPEKAPIPVHFFELELWTHSGIFLVGEKLPVVQNGNPISVMRGVVLDLVWDIQIRQMDPNVVKALKPGARGLTTRHGNWQMTSLQRRKLAELRENEAKVRALDAATIAKVGAKTDSR